MADRRPELVRVSTVQGQVTADIVKAHLESEGIPVMLKYESAGQIFGLTVDGLGQVHILVPADLADTARDIIAPRDLDQPGA